MIDGKLLRRLNAESRTARLAALEAACAGADFPAPDPRCINNHIHTRYSFSPYSPSAAVYAARAAGLCACGIVDHDSMGGAEEFIEAGRIAGIPTTVGIECRVSMAGTPFAGRRTNNPDQLGISYMVLHGVPHRNIARVQAYFQPLRERRNERNRAMLERINARMGLALDFARDVLPLSEFSDGGTVTERHLMLALARALRPGLGLLEEYDMVGALKKACIPEVYIPAGGECPSLEEITAFAADIGAILCYAYLGDVTESVTGDKRAQAFEDAYLEELLDTLASAGVRALTYMPTRNTDAQLARIGALAERCGMMQICGEDINSPRQSFVIEKLKEPRFQHLIESTWAVIRHENDYASTGGEGA
ncbi:MAG: PHP domain-containing protein [Clostridia bacterium]|nr:PHP domain-containing protein [Clostridia bacterium]